MLNKIKLYFWVIMMITAGLNLLVCVLWESVFLNIGFYVFVVQLILMGVGFSLDKDI